MKKFTKKTAAVLLAAMMALTLAGCSSSDTGEETSSADTENITINRKQAEEVDVENLSKEQENMLAPMDCVSSVETAYAPYDELDHGTVWEGLYLIIVNYTDVFGDEVTRDEEDNNLVVSEDVLVDCAYAMYDGFDGNLPEDGFGENINRKDDTYYFMDSDRGDSYTRISAWTNETDGTCSVETEVLSESEQELYATYRFTLSENAHAKDESDPLFTYTVTDLTEVSGDEDAEAEEDDAAAEDAEADDETTAAIDMDGDYILPESNSRNYTEEELADLTADELRLARNEIYARHGRIFDAPDLKEYFEGKSWYNGTVDGDDFDNDELNGYEQKNLDLIKELENKIADPDNEE